MEAAILFTALAVLILLAIASLRYGVDSREAFASAEHELARRGIVWSVAPSARDDALARDLRDAHRRRTTEYSPSAGCA